jgi:hypothetical protein
VYLLGPTRCTHLQAIEPELFEQYLHVLSESGGEDEEQLPVFEEEAGEEAGEESNELDAEQEEQQEEAARDEEAETMAVGLGEMAEPMVTADAELFGAASQSAPMVSTSASSSSSSSSDTSTETQQEASGNATVQATGGVRGPPNQKRRSKGCLLADPAGLVPSIRHSFSVSIRSARNSLASVAELEGQRKGNPGSFKSVSMADLSKDLMRHNLLDAAIGWQDTS